MLNFAQKTAVHLIAFCQAQRKAECIHSAFMQRVDAATSDFSRMAGAKIAFTLAVADTFGRSDEALKGDSLTSESIWDGHRAKALARWTVLVGKQFAKPDKIEMFSTYLGSVAEISAASAYKEAEITNRVLSGMYAELLPIVSALHDRDPEFDLMTEYASGLAVVWQAATMHEGHGAVLLAGLEDAIPGVELRRGRDDGIGQVYHFMREVGPQGTHTRVSPSNS